MAIAHSGSDEEAGTVTWLERMEDGPATGGGNTREDARVESRVLVRLDELENGVAEDDPDGLDFVILAEVATEKS